MLIDAGADGAAKTKSGQTAIDLASSEEVKAVLQTALSRGSVAAAGREVGEEEEGKPEGKKRARVSKEERKEEMKEKGEGDDSLVVPPPASKGEEGKE